MCFGSNFFLNYDVILQKLDFHQKACQNNSKAEVKISEYKISS